MKATERMLRTLAVILLGLCSSLCFGKIVKFYTYEEEPPGTVIAVLSEHSMFNTTDGPAAKFRLMKQLNKSFIQVRESDGQLSIGHKIDREKICRRYPSCLLTLDVVSFSSEHFKLFNLKVEVRDINDHSPHFPSTEIHLDVSEAASLGTRIPLPIAVDEDIGQHSVQDYLLSADSHFGIDVQTRADGLQYADLVLKKELDRESCSSYTLELVATDGGSPALSGSARIKVRVLDFNDNSPAFEESSVTVDLMEDAPVGHLLMDLNAIDPDEGPNGDIFYGFSPQVSQEVRELFKINPKSGGITLDGEVDFETKQSYEFDVQAQDFGPNPLSATCRVTVHIIDVNDNAPTISITPLTTSNHGVAYITEAAAKGSFIALISTSDIDSGLNGKVHCILHGHGHFQLQQAYEDSFMIVTTSLLDRESTAEYKLTLVAEDLGFPPLTTKTQYTIQVTDENDNAPLFTQPLYEVSVLENNAPGAYITTVLARDPDFQQNGKVFYRLLEGKTLGQSWSTFVAIDGDSGVVRAVRSLDYEKLKEIDLEIEASDCGVPKLSARTQLRIKIIDQNDSPPEITSPMLDSGSADVLLPTGAPENYLVLRVKAVDADDGHNSQLSYTIQHDKHKLFTINSESGEVSLSRRISPGQDKDLSIVVAVYDHGTPSLFCNATIRFLITEAFPSNLEIVTMQPSEGEQQMDMSTIFIAVLSGGCTLLLVAILFVACSCKKRSSHSKQLEEPGTETAGGLLNASTDLKGSNPTSIDSCQLSLSTESENCSVSTSRGQCRDLHSASSSSVSAPPCTTDWPQEKSAGSTSCSQTAQFSAKDSGKGDSDFNDSASDTSGEGLRKGSGPPPQEQADAPSIEKAMAFHSAKSQSIHRSNRSLYNELYAVQYQKEYAVSYTMAPSYYNTYHPRVRDALVPHYSMNDSYYHISHQPAQRDCERDPIYKSTTLSSFRMTRGHREFNYKPEITLQTHSEEVATTF